MLEILKFNKDLKLDTFFKECDKRGLVNNNSQERIYDSFKRYDKFQTWILFRDKNPVGSVVAHSFDDYKPGSFRILARTCILTDKIKFKRIGNFSEHFKQHQHVVPRYFVKTCIEWCGADSEMYFTTHPSETGKMKAVHNIITRFWSKMGLVKRIEDIEYRNSLQTVWKVNGRMFLDQINKYPPDKMNEWLNI